VVEPGGRFSHLRCDKRPIVSRDHAARANYLVVWRDARNSLPAVQRFDIYGSRIGFEGGVLEPNGIAICTNVAVQTTPAVAANGSNALVVWTDYRLNTTLGRIFASRVAGDGTVLDGTGLRLCSFTSAQSTPAVAGNGREFVVALG